MDSTFAQILEDLPGIRDHIRSFREMLLGNLVMISEIPAPTFEEEFRVRCLQDRFVMAGLQNCSTDELGNALAIRPSEIDSEEERNILLVAHADTTAEKTDDHTVSVGSSTLSGAGIGDNALGLAVLATLPMMLDRLDIKLKSNLVFMGATRSLARGNLAGLNFFLDNTKMKIDSGVCIEGLQLGRLSHSSIGMLRGEITCSVPDQYDWTRPGGVVGAIHIITEIISKISEIPVPRKPRTTVTLGSVRGGTGFSRVALRSVLRFEIRSESEEIVENLRERIEDIVLEISSQGLADINLEFFGYRRPGSIKFTHPMVRTARKILQKFDVKPKTEPSISELACFLDRGIPAITLGITRGEVTEAENSLQIEPMFTGITQLIGTILAIDNGCCDENS